MVLCHIQSSLFEGFHDAGQVASHFNERVVTLLWHNSSGKMSISKDETLNVGGINQGFWRTKVQEEATNASGFDEAVQLHFNDEECKLQGMHMPT